MSEKRNTTILQRRKPKSKGGSEYIDRDGMIHMSRVLVFLMKLELISYHDTHIYIDTTYKTLRDKDRIRNCLDFEVSRRRNEIAELC